MKQADYDPMSHDALVDRAYQQLPEVAPPDAIDEALARQARASRVSSGWIWPISIAASMVLCVGLFLQMGRLLTPSPLPAPRADEAPATAPQLGPPPPFGEGERIDTQVLELGLETIAASPSDPTDPEFWWAELRRLAAEADRDGFLVTWEAYQRHLADTPLPDDLTRWMADNNLPPISPAANLGGPNG